MAYWSCGTRGLPGGRCGLGRPGRGQHHFGVGMGVRTSWSTSTTTS
jgi:hypothetical protein